MTRDEARELFGEHIEGELEAERRAELEALLAMDAELKGEYDELAAVLRETHALAKEGDAPPADVFLDAVQTKLRVRSRGRFYRDRFATKSGAALWVPVVVAIVMLAIVVIAGWVVLE